MVAGVLQLPMDLTPVRDRTMLTRTGAGNNAASKTASSRPSGNGQDTLASPARRKYSRTAVLDTPTLPAISRWEKPSRQDAELQ